VADVTRSLELVRSRISRACATEGRDPQGVRIVAISKTVGAEMLREALGAGVVDFGENYVKELRAKRDAIPGGTWHFVGTLQSNTARHVADLADIVHTLEPGRAVRRLAARAARAGREMPSLIEVDFTGTRAGASPAEVEGLAEEVAELEGLRLAGLMTLPPMPGRPEDSRPYFRRLRGLGERVRERYPGAVELSMGMSADYEVAVEEGATMVRIGTALFGERPPP
jgi:hypothetical protein